MHQTVLLTLPTPIDLTTTSTGTSDTVAFVGLGGAGNQFINVNGGSYLDPSATLLMVPVSVPVAGTITSASFKFKYAGQSPFLAIFGGTYTLHAQLYYMPGNSNALIGSEQFYPVPGATVNFNLTTQVSIFVYSESLQANIAGLSFPIPAGSQLVWLVRYDISTIPFQLATLGGYVAASVGMQ